WNRATLLAMLGAALAMEDAGLGPGTGDPGRFGVLLGVNVLSWDLSSMIQYLVASESTEAPGVLDMKRANAFCMRSINPLDFSLKTLRNLIAGHVAIANDAQGFCRAMTEGHAGGARAIGDAFRLVGEGDLDVALCGGADDQLEEVFFATNWGAGVIASDDGRRGLGSSASSIPCLNMKKAQGDLGAAASPVELLACSAALEHATLPRGVWQQPRSAVPAFGSALVLSLGLFGECSALMVRR